jgi:hypothetical protein
MKSLRIKRRTRRIKRTKRGGTIPPKKTTPPIRPIRPPAMFPHAPAPPVFNIPPPPPPPPPFQPYPANANGVVPIYNPVPTNQQGVYRASATGAFGR